MSNTKRKSTPRPRSYHFDLGNSSAGPIGMCASIVATSRQAALLRLCDLLPREIEVAIDGARQQEYVSVYINPDAIKTRDIDDVVDPD